MKLKTVNHTSIFEKEILKSNLESKWLIDWCLPPTCSLLKQQTDVYICVAFGDPNIIEESNNVSNQLKKIPPHFCACSKPWPGFPKPYVEVFFVFNGLRLEVVVRFVDIGGIINHSCLIFIFIILMYIQTIFIYLCLDVLMNAISLY